MLLAAVARETSLPLLSRSQTEALEQQRSLAVAQCVAPNACVRCAAFEHKLAHVTRQQLESGKLAERNVQLTNELKSAHMKLRSARQSVGAAAVL